MNINNEYLKMGGKPVLTSIPGGNQTYIEHMGHFIMDVNLFMGPLKCKKVLSAKINALWFYEWLPWQPIMHF